MGLYGTIWDYMGLYRTMCDYLWLSGTIWDYLGLSWTIWDYLGLSGTILNYPGLLRTISDYFGLGCKQKLERASYSYLKLFHDYFFSHGQVIEELAILKIKKKSEHALKMLLKCTKPPLGTSSKHTWDTPETSQKCSLTLFDFTWFFRIHP